MTRLAIEAGKETMEAAEKLGIPSVPIHASDFVENGIEPLKQTLQEKNLSVCQIGVFGFNLLDETAGSAKQHDILNRAITSAKEFDCSYVVIHGGSFAQNPFGEFDPRNYEKSTIDSVAKSLEPFLRLAEDRRVNIAIEPYLKTAIHSADSFLALREKVASEALTINIDVTSLYTYYDLVSSDSIIEETCEKLRGHYALLHIKEVILRDGFHVHLDLAPLSAGKTNWEKILKLTVPHLSEKSSVMIEHASGFEEIKESLEIVRRCAQNAGVSLS